MAGEGRVGAGLKTTTTLVVYRKLNVLQAKQPREMNASVWDGQPEKPENLCTALLRWLQVKMFKWHSENEWNKIENPEEMRLPKQNTIQNKCAVPVVDTNNTSNSTNNKQRNSVNGNTTVSPWVERTLLATHMHICGHTVEQWGFIWTKAQIKRALGTQECTHMHK